MRAIDILLALHVYTTSIGGRVYAAPQQMEHKYNSKDMETLFMTDRLSVRYENATRLLDSVISQVPAKHHMSTVSELKYRDACSRVIDFTLELSLCGQGG